MQNMEQSNIALLPEWRALGNQGDLPVGWQGSGGGGGGDGRMNPLDVSSVPSVQGFVQGQFAAEDVPLQNLVTQMRAREQPLSIYQRQEEEAGVPELRASSKALSQEVASLEDAIFGIEGQVAGRTRESMVTEAQRTGMVQALREPMQENLARIGTALGRVQMGLADALQGVATKVGLALKGQEMDIEPLKTKRKYTKRENKE